MSHFAKLDENNVVVAVYRGRQEDDGKEAELSARSGENLKQTSYNNRIRKQYAGIGFTYDPVADVFIAPQPFPSWTLDSNHDWQPPTPQPDGDDWYWNEKNQQWEKQ
jgi:hypothetical protein